MNSTHMAGRWAPWGAALVVAAAAACGGGAPPKRPAADTGVAAGPATAAQRLAVTDEERKAGGITVETPQGASTAGEFTAPATFVVDETRTARIGSLAEGVVVEAPVQVGTHVRVGALLASIHSHMVHDAWAGYRNAIAGRRRAMTETAYAKDAEARATRLLAAKAASRQEAERAQADRAAAQEALVIAESEVQRSLDELEHLGIKPGDDLSESGHESIPITSNVAGVVLERLVTPGTAVTPGTPMFVVSDLSRLWAIAEIDEVRLPAMSAGRSVDLAVPAYPTRVFRGRVAVIGDVVDPQTRRVTVRIEVPNTDGALKPQMFATARLPAEDRQPVLTVPSAAVQKLDQAPMVFVEEQPGRFVPRRVTVGAERAGRTEILSGLHADDRVAITGTFLLKAKAIGAGQAE